MGDYYIEKMKSSSVQERRNAIKGIIDNTYFDWVRDRDERDIYYAIPALAEALYDEDGEVRKLAIQAIGIELHEFDEKCVFEIMPRIIEILFDKNRQDIKESASHLLKDAVTKGYSLKGHINELKPLLHDKNENVKFGVADALTHFYTRSGNIKRVIELLEHEDKDVRQEAVGTLGHYSTPGNIDLEPLLPYFIKLLNDKDEEVQLVAARSIGHKVQSAEILQLAIDKLLEMYNSSKPKIKMNAIRELGTIILNNISCRSKLPIEHWNILEPIVPILESEFESGNEEMKEFILPKLILYFLHTDKVKEIQTLLTAKNDKIKIRTLYDLDACWQCKIDIQGIIPSIVDIYFKSKNAELKKAAKHRMERIMERNHEYAVLIEKEISKLKINVDDEWDTIEKLRKALNRELLRNVENEYSNVNKKIRVKFLTENLKHGNPMVRAWAVYELYVALIYEKLKITKSVPNMIDLLEDEDYYVRERATAALGNIAEKVSIKNAIPFFAKLLRDKIDKIVFNVAWVLYLLAGQDTDIEQTIPDLIYALHNASKNSKDHLWGAIEKYMQTPNHINYLMELMEKGENKKFKKELIDVIKKKKDDLLRVSKIYAEKVWTQKQALNTYEAYLKIEPEDAKVWYQYAELLNKNNESSKAVDALKRCLELAPSDIQAKTLLSTLETKES